MRRLIALFALSLSLAFASSAHAQTEPATAAQTQVGMPTQNNAPLFSDPVKVPQGVVKFAAGDKTLLYFLDPDGVILELCEYR